MKCVNNVWLPDEEQEMTKFVTAEVIDGTGVYQYHKLRAALAFVQNWDTCIDIGAHCGLWSMQLEKKFKHVHAFEPIARHRECFEKNTQNAIVYPYALGEKDGVVRMSKGVKSTGDTCISDKGEYEAEVRKLDDFNISDVGFIKLDCEGYELFALKGGEKTIEAWRPVIIVEQKPGKAKAYGLEDTEAVQWLQKKGYKLHGAIAGDYILSK
jgi:hypothetical protein